MIFDYWINCNECIFYEDCEAKEDRDGCIFRRERMTNFEKIKSLTIEELADYVADGKYPNFPQAPCYICKYD